MIRHVKLGVRPARRAKARTVSTDCDDLWKLYPLSTDPSHPPGTRIVDGEPWTPSTDPTHGPCTMCDPKGDCWERWTPDPHKPPTDPDQTPLSEFPRWPVAYMQEARIGTDAIGTQRVLKRLDYPKRRPIGGTVYFLEERVLMASRWVDRAERFANTPRRKAWVARLRKEFFAPVMQRDCVFDCWSKFQHLWLIANAGQYLAEHWGKDAVKPPYVPPPKAIAQGIVDWLGNRVEEAAKSHKLWWVLGAIGVGAGAWYFIRRAPTRRPTIPA